MHKTGYAMKTKPVLCHNARIIISSDHKTTRPNQIKTPFYQLRVVTIVKSFSGALFRCTT